MPKLNEQIVLAAREMIDWPYRHAGRNEFGIDCVGLIIKAAHDCNITAYDTTNYPKRPNAIDLRREMKEHLTRIPNEELESGDIAIFAFHSHPCHMGIIDIDEKGTWVIHAFAPARKVVREELSVMTQRAVHIMSFRYTGK
jgi:cell wall-associated NlpC family hydrolase